MNKIIVNEIVLIGSEIKSKKIIRYHNKISQKKDYSYNIFATNQHADLSLTRNHVSHQIGNHYLQEKRESIETATNQWLNEWIFSKRIDGISIFDNFMYENESWWWFIDRRIRYELLEVFLLIKALQSINNQYQAEKITVYDETNCLQSLVPEIFRTNSLEFNSLSPKIWRRIKNPFQRKVKRHLGSRFLQSRERIIEFLSKRIFSKYSKDPKTKDPCIATSTGFQSWRLCYNPLINQYEKGDFYFQSIHALFSGNSINRVVELYKIQKIRKDLSIVKEKFATQRNMELVFLNSFMTSEGKKQFNHEFEIFKKKLRHFERKLLRKEDLVFCEVNFSSIMADRLFWFFSAYLPLGLRWKALFKGFVKKIKPSVLFFWDEFFTTGRALIYGAQTCENTLSFAIQHGFMSEFELGISELNGISQTNFTIPPVVTPDYTAVYGSYYEKMLLNQGYPKEKIIISGNPNYDFIPSLIGSNIQNDDYEQLNLAPNKKTIVFGTQPDLYEYSIEPLSTLINLGEKHKDIQLIIKVHPREDSSRYLEFQKKANFPIRIVKKMNIFSVIKLCDIYITFHSTTILDALILGKPVATFNFDNRENPLKFLKTKAIIELKTPKETMELIPKILEDDSFILELEKYRKEFLFEQIYKIDGNAATRIVNSVIKIDNKKN